MKQRSVVISGGGTGGHLYPALAVGRRLRERDPAIRLTYIGSHRPLEKDLMDRHGAHFIPMRIEGLKGRGLRGLKTLLLLPFALLRSFALLARFKPDLVVGVGGYSAGPVVLAASLLRVPTLILEQNATPGFTNRLLIRWAKKAVVAFEDSLAHFQGKGIFLGNPVREEFYRLRPKPRAEILSLLIFGGSQGSRVLYEGLMAALPLHAPEKARLRIYHQTGKTDFDRVKQSYAQNGFEAAEVAPFFFDMPSYFEKADLVISRAGATTIAELIVAQKAALLVPFAQASEDHQRKIAAELVRVDGAEMILEADLTPQLLAGRVLFYLRHPERLSAIERNLASLKTEDPAGRIADLCFDRMNKDA